MKSTPARDKAHGGLGAEDGRGLGRVGPDELAEVDDAEEDEETSYQEASYQPEIVVPSSIHLSSMSKSTSSSPWVTDDSFDNDDDAFRFEQHPNREVMGESTAQFINKQDP